ncbi:membrane integrity-associated transporter subunit PqiC [Desulfosarcina sp.]|uniref:PqiC family protein n=1 Tax=Desulfosarcina sp. TaxID=2027861 RepID=UPI00356A2D39
MNRLSLWTLAFICSLIISLSGCRSITPSVSYYILNPLTVTSISAAAADGERSKTVGVNPIELPGYLNRVQMVKRTGPNQLEVSSHHRWADFPDRMIQQVLGDNLQMLMSDARVYTAPWPAGLKPDVTVDVTFLELIGTTDKTMLLGAVWTITGNGDPSPSRWTRISETITGPGFDALAAAHSRVLEAFCREVAETLNRFPIH